jgi:hypothetical protein
MATTTTSIATSTTEDSVTSAIQEELGEYTRGPDTPKGEVFCPTLMREDLEASDNLWL